MGTDKLVPAKAGWVLTYSGRTEVGGKWRSEVQADRVTPTASETRSKAIETDIPPDPDVLKAAEIADSGRPNAYLWTVEDTVKGCNVSRAVSASTPKGSSTRRSLARPTPHIRRRPTRRSTGSPASLPHPAGGARNTVRLDCWRLGRTEPHARRI